MNRSHRWPHLIAVALIAAAVSACDISGVGSGNRPEKLEIIRNPNTSLIDLGGEVEQYFLCFPEQLQAVLRFSNGNVDASSLLNTRVRWSSSDPAVVQVSNDPRTGGEVVLIPGSTDRAFAPGILVPRSVGTATITAEFVGLTSADFKVQIREFDSVTINKTAVKLAPETGDLLTLTATVDGYTLDVTSSPLWSFDTDDENANQIATIGQSTGLITGVGIGGPLTAKAEFPLCTDNPRYSNFTATVVVEALTGLQITREFADAPNDELIVATSERISATGSFADGATMDLTGQVRLESSDAQIATALITAPQFLSALKAGTVQIQAVYGGDDDNDEEGDTDPPQVRSNTITLNVVDGELQDFQIAPSNPTINARGFQQFVAIGSFNVAGQTRSQTITRGVVWSDTTLNDESTAEVTAFSDLLRAGRVVSNSVEAGTYKITATRGLPSSGGSGNASIVRSTVLCVVKPNTPEATCPPPEEGEESTP
ncbi:hypothetical protein [Sinimarinibacterium thermocellulolyticum]|uniref:Uncharacterized protein n=1 Tax=Sinimarinibacterium thermocellulolyticum TaxID=3170016 RepID=A0ABV2AAB2_9GAMM